MATTQLTIPASLACPVGCAGTQPAVRSMQVAGFTDYVILSGDTLGGLGASWYGDWREFPHIWAINHTSRGGPFGDNPNLIRGGPYEDRRDPCFICHYREQYSDIYVHEMLDAGENVVELNGKPICLFCHREKPDPMVDRTKDVTFKADVGFLCWRCHLPMPETRFFGAHFLVEPARQTLRYMKSFEKKNTIILPIVPHNRITCSTCHNPHQKGVIKHEPATKGAGEKGRVSRKRQELCRACHNV